MTASRQGPVHAGDDDSGTRMRNSRGHRTSPRGVVMTLVATDTRTVPLGPCIKVTGMSAKSAGDLHRDVRGGVVVRRELFERLNRAGRVAEVSGPAGSGKSVLLRSWIDEAALAEHVAQVSVPEEDRDPQRFWTSVVGALRSTVA